MTQDRDNTRFRVRHFVNPPSVTQPPVPPIYPSVVFQATDADELDRVYEREADGFTYAREGHPNAAMLGQRIADMEGAEAGIVACSGMAAVSAALVALLGQGDHLIAGDQLYGRCTRIVTRELPRFGISCTTVDASSANAVRAAIRDETRLILVEAVSNPLLRVADVRGIAKIAQEQEIIFVVDNTFPTPLGLRPLELGASLVVHSATKQIAGHSDATLGIVCGASAMVDQVFDTVVTWGWNSSPFDCWLAERGLSTLGVRFAQSQSNAAALADWLSECERVEKVYYPGRSDHCDHLVAKDHFDSGFGSMVTFELPGGRAEVNQFLRGLKSIPFAPTLGDVATMVSHPASSSHRAMTVEQRAKLGICEGTIRVSVGIEHISVLIDEFRTALLSLH